LDFIGQAEPICRGQALVKLSIVLPAHNGEGCLEGTLRALDAELRKEGIEHELLVVNDHSTDATGKISSHFQSKEWFSYFVTLP
jgi:glycosyltransferase involved in cell wall biosynthesis